MTRGGTVRK